MQFRPHSFWIRRFIVSWMLSGIWLIGYGQKVCPQCFKEYAEVKQYCGVDGTQLMSRSSLSEDLIKRATDLASQGKFNEAIENCTKAIELDKKNQNAWFKRGLYMINTKQYSAAIDDYQEVLRLTPKEAAAFNNLGLCYYRLLEYHKALSCYDSAISINRDYALYHANRGEVLSVLKRYSDAVESFAVAAVIDDKILDSHPSFLYHYGASLFLLKRYADASRFLEKYVITQHDDKSLKEDGLFKLAHCYSPHLQRHADAISIYDRLIRDFSAKPLYFNNRAWNKALLGRFSEALPDAEKALSLESEDVNSIHTRGFIHAGLRNYSKALDDYKKALKLDPKMGEWYPDLLYDMGVVYEKLNMRSDAIRAYEQFLAAKKVEFPENRTKARDSLDRLKKSR